MQPRRNATTKTRKPRVQERILRAFVVAVWLPRLMERDLFRVESVEHQPLVEQRALDHRVALKRGERIVEALDGAARRIPLRRHAQFVFAVLAGQRQLAHDRLVLVSTEGPAQYTDVAVIVARWFYRGGARPAWRGCRHAAAVRTGRHGEGQGRRIPPPLSFPRAATSCLVAGLRL